MIHDLVGRMCRILGLLWSCLRTHFDTLCPVSLPICIVYYNIIYMHVCVICMKVYKNLCMYFSVCVFVCAYLYLYKCVCPNMYDQG